MQEDLDPRHRLPRVQDKLQQQILLSDGKVIIALQEVSMSWLGPTLAFFLLVSERVCLTSSAARRLLPMPLSPLSKTQRSDCSAVTSR